jgi:hypothetical protein
MRHLSALGLLLPVAAENDPQARCTVSGRLVDAVSGEPLKKAQLTLRHAPPQMRTVHPVPPKLGGAFFSARACVEIAAPRRESAPPK